MRDSIQRTNCSVFWMHGKQAGVTSGKIGVMHADDAEGQAMMAAITAFAVPHIWL